VDRNSGTGCGAGRCADGAGWTN